MESPQRYLALFRQAPVMAAILDVDGRILDVSAIWAARMGYSRAELLRRRPIELASAPSARQIREQYIPRYRETGRLDRLAIEFDAVVNLKPSGAGIRGLIGLFFGLTGDQT